MNQMSVMLVPSIDSTRRRAPGVAALALLVLAAWVCIAPLANATSLAPSLPHAGPNAGNPEPQPQRTASSPVGTLPGSFVVDDRGAARYSIPLDIPPAARGLEPTLSLEYDS